MKEIWKDVIGYEALYQVSNQGNVRTKDSYGRKNRWEGKFFKKSRSIKCIYCPKGYLKVTLYNEGVKKNFFVHRLVGYAFLKLTEEYQINHLNGITDDNRVNNLEVCDARRNRQHAYEIGLQTGIRGEKNHYAKLTENEVKEIRRNLLNQKDRQISKEFNVHYSTINRIRNNKIWVEYT